MNDGIARFYKIVGQKLGISKSVLERSIMLHIAAEKSPHFKGKNPDVVAASAIYLISRISDTPYTLKEISDACGMQKKDIARCYRLLTRTKEEFKLGKLSKRQKQKLLLNVGNDGYFIECPKC